MRALPYRIPLYPYTSLPLYLFTSIPSIPYSSIPLYLYTSIPLLTIDVFEKLPLNIFILEFSAEIGCSCFAVGVAHTPGGYAHVVCVQHHTNVFCAKDALHFFSDLN